MFEVHNADCLEWLRAYDGALFDACVTDPPYELGFMGKKWDNSGVAFRPETWRAVYDVLKPGAHLVAFSGTRTYHRMVCAIEDAGFEIRDQLAWGFGSGFPKSHDVSKAIDKAAGVEREVVGDNPNHRAVSGVNYEGVYAGGNTGAAHLTAPATPEAAQWQGWGTALKPAWEPICLARKPLSEKTVAANVLQHGTGAINVDGCRVPTSDNLGGGAYAKSPTEREQMWGEDAGNSWRRGGAGDFEQPEGRFPANLCHDGSDEVLALFPDSKGQQGDVRGTEASRTGDENTNCYGEYGRVPFAKRDDSGSAARFFYCAKASKKDRGEGNLHPTVKPTDLMRWLCRLVTPPGGTILDPFNGSGSTGRGAVLEGFNYVGLDLDPDYIALSEQRIHEALAESCGDLL